MSLFLKLFFVFVYLFIFLGLYFLYLLYFPSYILVLFWCFNNILQNSSFFSDFLVLSFIAPVFLINLFALFKDDFHVLCFSVAVFYKSVFSSIFNFLVEIFYFHTFFLSFCSILRFLYYSPFQFKQTFFFVTFSKYFMTCT